MPAQPAKSKQQPPSLAWDFKELVRAIREVHDHSAATVGRVVNQTLTLRNWIIGFFIREYEQNGADRAKYGEALVERLSADLSDAGYADLSARSLRLYRQFFIAYPGIWQSVTAELPLPASGTSIWQSLIAKWPTVLSPDALPPSMAEEESGPGVNGRTLVESLSFTHLARLASLEDPLKRAFYEIECIRGNWPVRTLKRQIATLYFERSGLSDDKEKLAAMVKVGVEEAEPRLAIRDPYVFEFLGLNPKDAVEESDLEAALVENLREFLLELGHGFCLEAQQKSITIGNTRGFVDLVFYHRILKCHVLVELKVDEFTHENIGQLNTYVTWYRKHMMSEGDNPPVGLLLCTDKDHALVEYAIASMSNRLFVSKYQLELPKKEELERFLQEKRREIRGELT